MISLLLSNISVSVTMRYIMNMKCINIFCYAILGWVAVVYSCRHLDIYNEHGKYNVTCLSSSYKNITNIDSIIKCAARCIMDTMCHTINYETATELCFWGGAICSAAEYAPGFEMLVIGQEVKHGQSCLSWPQLADGDVARTVQYEGQSGMAVIVRATMNDGQVLPSWKPMAGSEVYVAYNGQPTRSTTYDTLVVHPTCAVLWQKYDGNLIPEKAAIGGDRTGTGLYIARIALNSPGQSVYVAGYLNPGYGQMYYAMSSTSVRFTDTDIEILIVI